MEKLSKISYGKKVIIHNKLISLSKTQIGNKNKTADNTAHNTPADLDSRLNDMSPPMSPNRSDKILIEENRESQLELDQSIFKTYYVWKFENPETRTVDEMRVPRFLKLSNLDCGSLKM